MENVLEYLEDKWKKLTGFNQKEDLKAKCWNEIIEQYSRRNRFYHNLTHIGNLFRLFDENVAAAENGAIIGFAIFYHDVIYDTLRNDNEEQSAAKAKEHMLLLKLKPALVNNVVALILASKTHVVDENAGCTKDMSLFLDLDLAVLGDDWKDYEYYSNSIRKEFQQYNDQVFKNGRQHALQQILQKESIYYTPKFYEELESKARQNLQREISLLGNTL
jgi:predicted metal-dependent HD superfamily phosphohydrolase